MKKITAGDRFGRLVVIDFSHRNENNGMGNYHAVCDCGNTCTVSHGNLQSGHTKSCGCLKREAGVANRTHGFKKNHKTYKSWCKIKERCFNKNCPDYPNYGGKGITVDKYFLDDFLNFYNEIGEAPLDGKAWSVDRIDYTRNYEPGNIRWATDVQQARNKGKMKNNTSGVNGVNWEDKRHPNGLTSTTYAVVQWKEDFKNNKKCFSAKKYGLLEAFNMAVEFRKETISRLNSLGYGYSENHGS